MRLPVHIAVIHVNGAICHITAATSEQDLAAQLASYVRQHSPHQLVERDAARLEQLLSVGSMSDAVDFYFASVGRRWDLERLVTTRVDVPLPVLPAD
jgi:hypothetical protein